MPDEPENLTLRLLQDMRARMDTIQTRMDEIHTRMDEIHTKIDGNTVILNLLAGLLHNHEERIDALEAKVK